LETSTHAARVIVGHDIYCHAEGILKTLGLHGYDARPVYYGNEVIDLAEIWRPRSAVIEMQIPGMPGVEVAQELRRRHGNAMRLIAFTQRNLPHFRDEALEAGFDDVVIQLADPAEILLALGGPGAVLVRRSREALFKQANGMVALGNRLLDRRRHLRDERERRDSAMRARRAFQWSATTFDSLPLEDESRSEVQRSLKRLADRLVQAEAD
jgi:DNA-binding response OmpR family regulator